MRLNGPHIRGEMASDSPSQNALAGLYASESPRSLQRYRPMARVTTTKSMSKSGKYTVCEVTASPVSLLGFKVQNHSQKNSMVSAMAP